MHVCIEGVCVETEAKTHSILGREQQRLIHVYCQKF
jgi:hypothetical protein